MKKVLDLTKCNSTDEICDVLEKEIAKTEADNKQLDEAVDETINEFEDEYDEAVPSRKGILKRIISGIKKMFKR